MLNTFTFLLTGTGSNKAIEDILNHGRYEGAIETISKVTKFVDMGSIMFISFVSFLIISVAIWRNVLAGAYAAYPKFWDAVHVAHEDVKDVGWLKSIMGLKDKYQDINMGSIKRMIMRILPDIKVLTDFEDDTVEPKTYFTKAIAQMVAVVMIGVFIYNGYYRDTTIVVAKFGSELFNRVLLSVDPIEVFDRIAATSGTPDFGTDNALMIGDKRVNELSKKAYKAIIGKYTDISSADQKAKLAASIESKVSAWLQTHAGYYDSESWKFSGAAKLTVSGSTMSDTSSADGLQESRVYSINVSELDFESTKAVGETWYLNLIVQYTKTNKEDSKVYDLEMALGYNVTTSGGSTVWTLNGVSGEGAEFAASGAVDVVLTDINSGDAYRAKFKNNTLDFGKNPPKSSSGTYTVSGLKYKVGVKEYKVTKLVLAQGSGASPVIKIVGTSNVFNWGDEIKVTNTEENSTEKSSETK